MHGTLCHLKKGDLQISRSENGEQTCLGNVDVAADKKYPNISGQNPV